MKDKQVRGFLIGAGILGKQPDGKSADVLGVLEEDGLYVRLHVQHELEELKKRITNMEKAINILMTKGRKV